MSAAKRRHTVVPKETARDIIGYLVARHQLGIAIIITDRPSIFLSLFRKHWWREISTLRKARASTLDPSKILEISHDLLIMETLRFGSSNSLMGSVNVCVLSEGQLQDIPTDCATIILHSYYTLESLPESMQRAEIIDLCKDRCC